MADIEPLKPAVPRTVVVPQADPVAQARAELVAALAAIEEKANLPKRAAGATRRGVADARRAARRHPGATVVLVVGAAAAVGLAVWGAVTVATRPRV